MLACQYLMCSRKTLVLEECSVCCGSREGEVYNQVCACVCVCGQMVNWHVVISLSYKNKPSLLLWSLVLLVFFPFLIL